MSCGRKKNRGNEQIQRKEMGSDYTKFENNSQNPAETPQFPYVANVVRSQVKCEADISLCQKPCT